MKRTSGIGETADDLPALTDPKGLSTRGAREIDLRNIDLGEIALSKRKPCTTPPASANTPTI